MAAHPSSRRNGRAQPPARGTAATARTVTLRNAPRSASRSAAASARTCSTATPVRPRALATCRTKLQGRRRPSIRVICQSGRASFRTSPGTPGPVPISRRGLAAAGSTASSSSDSKRRCSTCSASDRYPVSRPPRLHRFSSARKNRAAGSNSASSSSPSASMLLARLSQASGGVAIACPRLVRAS